MSWASILNHFPWKHPSEKLKTVESSQKELTISSSYLIIALGLVFLWRFLFSLHMNLLPDECSYWTWSRFLDWSYFDNSGMTAYLIRISTEIFGKSTPFSVRFPFLILSGLTTYFLYRTSQLLFRDSYRALLVATLFNLAPIALLGGSLAMHDNALMFFWTLALWAAAHFLRNSVGKWFFVMGLAAGLAIQSKYTGILILPCLLSFFLWSRQHRPWLLRPEPWIGVGIAVACTLPILWWNFLHEWASLGHILFIGSGATSWTRRLSDGFGYHIAQFLLISPLWYVTLLATYGSVAIRAARDSKPEEKLLLCFSLPLLLFGVQSFWGHVEANWGVMGYLALSILAVEAISRANREKQPRILHRFTPSYFRWALVLALGLSVCVVLHAWIGLLPACIEANIAKEDRIIWETRGWDGLGIHVGALRKSDDVVAGDSYQLCALLEFNIPGQPLVRYLAPWNRPTQFDVRDPSFDSLKGTNILFVSPRPLQPSSPVRTTIYEHFARVEELPAYEVLYHGIPIRHVYVYRGYSFDPFIPHPLGPRSLRYDRK